MKNKIIFPGTFDPITLGHLDIISRASFIFKHIILAIAENKNKKTMFSINERVSLAKQVTSNFDNIEVISYSQLITTFAKQHKTNILIRGIRSVSDFEYELQLANINKHLEPKIETLFLISSQNLSFISSSLIKNIIKYNGDISSFLPSIVLEAILKKTKI
ncbi:pantetheine-phosphate adenylyltransferase [Candidatus Providencia siddallii]|uniref:Phosphopantetheine adenylyltransferase n=1 Tax=Candidatus Providencia siddallii TaxID=1715285 RepID=A0ABM9NNE0_9GAMM